MEVHHHAHTAPKKRTHYFWEFLMLFLAVFCGFLAEYQLEHTIEHQREEKYMQSMIADLKNDTAEFRTVIAFNIKKIHDLDTLASLLNKPALTTDDEKQLYILNFKYALNYDVITFRERTIRQLLTSGNLRLIHKQAISDSIMDYYGQEKDDLSSQGEFYVESMKQLIIYSQGIFNLSLLKLNMHNDSSFRYESFPEKMELLTLDKNVLKRYSQSLLHQQGILANYIRMLRDMRKKAEHLLIFLQHEYHIN